MDRVQDFDTLDLNENPTCHNKIGPMFAYQSAFVRNRHADLTCVRKGSVIQLDTQRFLVGSLE